MSDQLILNYDDLLSFTKQFRDEGEDILQLYSNTRHRVNLLRDEWNGEAADAFYEEMELELLPTLQRISDALILCNEALIKIMKIMYSADEETASLFTKDLNYSFEPGGFQESFASEQPTTIYSPLKPAAYSQLDAKLPFTTDVSETISDSQNIKNTE